MSEKPQETREGDLLEQIFTQGLEKIKTPPQAAAEPPPEAESSGSGPERDGKALSPAARESKGADVTYLLLILFCAAFFITLLAFFVQRSSHETALSDLQNSMDLSRQELLEQISALEEKSAELEENNAAIREELSVAYADLARWRDRYEMQHAEMSTLSDEYQAELAERLSWETFWEMERYYQAGDLEACAALLILKDQRPYVYRTPDIALERYDEIVQAAIGAGYLKGDFQQNPKDYWELLNSYLSRFFASAPD